MGTNGNVPGPKVLLICTGLGTTNRGFETFFRQCFDALNHQPSLDIKLLKGAGKEALGERALWNLHRAGTPAKCLGLLLGNRPYVVEQITFSIPLFFALFRERPDVIFFSDKQIGNILWNFRKLTGMKYRLLLSNGTPQAPPYSHADHVQLLTPDQERIAVAAGIPEEFRSLVPYGLDMAEGWTPLEKEEKLQLLKRLNLPLDRKIVISIGWVNENHKRMGYLVKEIASITEDRPFLLILGQQDEQSKAILDSAARLLGPNDCRIATVPSTDVGAYLQAADIFVLCSREEGFGRVYLEAVAEGLRCIAHDFPNARYLLGDAGIFGDLNLEGELSRLVKQSLMIEDTVDDQRARRSGIYRRFSWEKLREEYVEMFRKVLTMTTRV